MESSTRRCGLYFLSTLLLLLLVSAQRGIKRNIKIINDTSGRILIFWVHPQTREPSLMSDAAGIPSGADFPLDSFVGHEFEVRELASQRTGACKDNVCRHAYFAVSENDEQTARVTEANGDNDHDDDGEGFVVEFVDTKVKASLQAKDLVADCRKGAADKLAKGDATAMDQFTTCVQEGVASALEVVNEEISFQASVRKDIAASLENYTCIDESLNSTADIETKVWDDPRNPSQKFNVHVKHNRPASKIHTIEGFILPEECAAMEESAKASLHDATVADVSVPWRICVYVCIWTTLSPLFDFSIIG